VLPNILDKFFAWRTKLEAEYETELKRRIFQFLSRDHELDIAKLNVDLALKKSFGAGFDLKLPPIPYTGNPFLLTPGNCIAVLGINPKALDDKKDNADREFGPLIACVQSLRSGDQGALSRYLALRAGYFDDDSEIFYKPYFTKLGGHLAREWFGHSEIEPSAKAAIAKRIFRQYVFKADILPWFSANTAQVDPVRLANVRGSNDALHAYYELLSLFLVALKPRWIQINGLQMNELVRSFLNIGDLETIQVDVKHRIMFGNARVFPPLGTSVLIPVLIHGFTNSPSGPQTAKAFNSVASAFREKMTTKWDAFKFI
jgi:hypothetical protein